MNHQPEMQNNGRDDMTMNAATREEREVARRRREAERKLAEHYEQAEHGASHAHAADEAGEPGPDEPANGATPGKTSSE